MGAGTRTREVLEAALAEGTTPDPEEFVQAMNADAARQFAALAADSSALLGGKAPEWTGKARDGAGASAPNGATPAG